jgi:hypothetical protein
VFDEVPEQEVTAAAGEPGTGEVLGRELLGELPVERHQVPDGVEDLPVPPGIGVASLDRVAAVLAAVPDGVYEGLAVGQRRSEFRPQRGGLRPRQPQVQITEGDPDLVGPECDVDIDAIAEFLDQETEYSGTWTDLGAPGS